MTMYKPSFITLYTVGIILISIKFVNTAYANDLSWVEFRYTMHSSHCSSGEFYINGKLLGHFLISDENEHIPTETSSYTGEFEVLPDGKGFKKVQVTIGASLRFNLLLLEDNGMSFSRNRLGKTREIRKDDVVIGTYLSNDFCKIDSYSPGKTSSPRKNDREWYITSLRVNPVLFNKENPVNGYKTKGIVIVTNQLKSVAHGNKLKYEKQEFYEFDVQVKDVEQMCLRDADKNVYKRMNNKQKITSGISNCTPWVVIENNVKKIMYEGERNLEHIILMNPNPSVSIIGVPWHEQDYIPIVTDNVGLPAYRLIYGTPIKKINIDEVKLIKY